MLGSLAGFGQIGWYSRMKKPFRYIPAGTRLVSAVPDLDWDWWLGELKTKREAREAAAAEAAKHYQSDVAGEGS